ncbi:PssD/Cps14F family polysaccharide biosynthesis glycosyltransferase [Anaerorhabdus furcosa]|uniref:Oligosaccharide biosynthesis protein Alg14 like n=1 Tax=Anaerorhabdus furcosa TaxID=118967 RepID=A0A1T4NYA7_9FIRM|nr:PssD/Cps14F family polysaccharide biosynthesis glycosyltransferase [Anaerorhabdus furcosa]SJZ84047.1 Oligosaccharide biosynthesis protein Alg14 like [Anaerorhabdus furcosa]
MKKVIFISSTGGHLTELMQLAPMFDGVDATLITENTASNSSLKDKYGSKFHTLVYGTKQHLFSYLFIFAFNILKSFVLFIKIRPDYIITTGTHTAVPMCKIAHLFKKKVIYIETFANSKTPTQAGQMIYPIADLFIVQWESMLEVYPKAVYGGWIF